MTFPLRLVFGWLLSFYLFSSVCMWMSSIPLCRCSCSLGTRAIHLWVPLTSRGTTVIMWWFPVDCCALCSCSSMLWATYLARVYSNWTNIRSCRENNSLRSKILSAPRFEEHNRSENPTMSTQYYVLNLWSSGSGVRRRVWMSDAGTTATKMECAIISAA